MNGQGGVMRRSAYILALAGAVCGAILLARGIAVANSEAPAAERIARGKYLVQITGCNDCHTSGYPQSGGRIPVQDWLLGSELGWRGPWGTTYPPNLRLYMRNVTEDQWVALAHQVETRPPMPWFALRDMNERDLRDIYRFIQSLGTPGNAAPDYVPPAGTPRGPFVQFPG